MLKRNRQRGFTLIELLIVVAIIGIIAAILIPNLLDALQKAKQKRTVSDIRNTGTALMAWLTDQVGAASAGQAKIYNPGNTFSMADFGYATVFNYLRPSSTFFYMQEVPQSDGWGYPLRFALSGTTTGVNILQAGVIMIGAPARDNAWGQWASAAAPVTVEPFITTDYNQDIVWADGYFCRWPEKK